MTHIDEFPKSWIIGLDSIDNEHKHLVDRIRRYEIGGKKSSYHDGCFLDSFLLRLRRHFEVEERIMVDCGYPGAEQHQVHHKQVYDRLNALRGTSLSESDVAQECLKAFIRDVVVEDLKFKKFWESDENRPAVEAYKNRDNTQDLDGDFQGL